MAASATIPSGPNDADSPRLNERNQVLPVAPDILLTTYWMPNIDSSFTRRVRC